jgi:uncharacterized protein YecT (DUF1311 family)
MKRFVIGACLTLMCGSAFAQPPAEFAAIDAKLAACLAKDGSTPGVDLCNDQAKTAADKILNRVYGAWVDRLNHPAKGEAADNTETLKRLLAAERAWITYRDKDCDLQSTSMLGGTGESNVYGHCQYVKTKQRVLDLEDIENGR